MKHVFMTVFAAFITLFSSIGVAAPQDAGATTYVVKKGDTLTAIAKRFPGNTVSGIAKANAIANPDRIYPGRVLSFSENTPAVNTASSQTNAAAAVMAPQVRTAVAQHHRTTAKNGAGIACDMTPIISRLAFPPRVSEEFAQMLVAHTNTQERLPFSGVVVHDGADHHLSIDDRCVATKIVDRQRTHSQKLIQATDRTQENTAALTPRQSVDLARSSTVHMNQGSLTDTELERFLAQVRKELQEIMGEAEDVTPLVMPLALTLLQKAGAGEATKTWLKK